MPILATNPASRLVARRHCFLLAALLGLLAGPWGASGLFAQWTAGTASVDITPEHPMWMGGYGSRSEPSDGLETPLFAKALYLEDPEGRRALLLTLDLVGIDRESADRITDLLEERHGLKRDEIAICTSHTHSGPVVARNLGPLHYWLLSPEQQRLVDEYAEVLVEKVGELVASALSEPVPARLQWGSGHASFAVNRRENRPESEVPERRSKGRLAGPVDHDVPVLSVRGGEDELLAVVFGYACHATVVSFLQWSGDYPGYAQAALEERYPGAVALFWAGCGADQNPLPRREVALAEHYGAELASAVTRVLDGYMPELAPTLTTSWTELEAPLSTVPAREALEREIENSSNRFEVARARYLLREMEQKGELEPFYPYPIGHWTLGDRIDFVFLGGEVVVDYALRLKRERRGRETWVAGYANDVMAYIPSLRVLREGGYEGDTSNVYYGLPSLWDESLEELLIEAVPAPPAGE